MTQNELLRSEPAYLINSAKHQGKSVA